MCSCKNEAHEANYCNYNLSRDIKKKSWPFNPNPDPNKTIVALHSQGKELVFGQNAGQQCVAMGLYSLVAITHEGSALQMILYK